MLSRSPMKRILRKSPNCLNCGEELKGDYCHICGQANTHYHASLSQVIFDFLSEFVEFDSKFFRSFRPLLLKPGFLTREFNMGRRSSYISPFRLYIFISILFFFVIMTVGQDGIVVGELEEATNEIDEVLSNEELTEEDRKDLVEFQSMVRQFLGTEEMDPELKDNLINFEGEELENSDSWLIRRLKEKEEQIDKMDAVEFQRKLASEFKNNFPKIMFLLLPVFAIILKVLYARRKIYYVEHLIFSFHFHTFVFIVLLISTLISYAENLFLLVILIYLFIAMREVYRQSIVKTVVKYGLLLFSYSFSLMVSFVIIMMITILQV
jgi:hypothetical protein